MWRPTFLSRWQRKKNKPSRFLKLSRCRPVFRALKKSGYRPPADSRPQRNRLGGIGPTLGRFRFLDFLLLIVNFTLNIFLSRELSTWKKSSGKRNWRGLLGPLLPWEDRRPMSGARRTLDLRPREENSEHWGRGPRVEAKGEGRTWSSSDANPSRRKPSANPCAPRPPAFGRSGKPGRHNSGYSCIDGKGNNFGRKSDRSPVLPEVCRGPDPLTRQRGRLEREHGPVLGESGRVLFRQKRGRGAELRVVFPRKRRADGTLKQKPIFLKPNFPRF